MNATPRHDLDLQPIITMMSHFRPTLTFFGVASTVALCAYVTQSRHTSKIVSKQHGNRFVPVERSCGGV